MPPAKYWHGDVKHIEQQWDETRTAFIPQGICFPSYRKEGALLRLDEQGRVVESSAFQKRFGGSRVLQFVSLIDKNPTAKLRRAGLSILSLAETANRIYKSLVPIALALLVTLSLARVQQREPRDLRKLLTELETSQANQLETVNYDKAGVSFSYPSNWRVQEVQKDTKINSGTSVLVIESDDAVVKIRLMPIDSPITLRNFAHRTVAERQVSIKGIVTLNRISLIERNANGEFLHGIRHSFSIRESDKITVYNQEFFEITNENTRSLITMQAPDVKWDNFEKGFQVIIDSLKF